LSALRSVRGRGTQYGSELVALGLRQSQPRVLRELIDELRRRHNRGIQGSESRALHELKRERLLVRFEPILPVDLPDDDAAPNLLRVGEELVEPNHGYRARHIG
jgi:hypothetical protein